MGRGGSPRCRPRRAGRVGQRGALLCPATRQQRWRCTRGRRVGQRATRQQRWRCTRGTPRQQGAHAHALALLRGPNPRFGAQLGRWAGRCHAPRVCARWGAGDLCCAPARAPHAAARPGGAGRPGRPGCARWRQPPGGCLRRLAGERLCQRPLACCSCGARRQRGRGRQCRLCSCGGRRAAAQARRIALALAPGGASQAAGSRRRRGRLRQRCQPRGQARAHHMGAGNSRERAILDGGAGARPGRGAAAGAPRAGAGASADAGTAGAAAGRAPARRQSRPADLPRRVGCGSAASPCVALALGGWRGDGPLGGARRPSLPDDGWRGHGPGRPSRASHAARPTRAIAARP